MLRTDRALHSILEKNQNHEYNENDFYKYLHHVRKISQRNDNAYLDCTGTHGYILRPSLTNPILMSRNEASLHELTIGKYNEQQKQANLNYNVLEEIEPHEAKQTVTTAMSKMMEYFPGLQQKEKEKRKEDDPLLGIMQENKSQEVLENEQLMSGKNTEQANTRQAYALAKELAIDQFHKQFKAAVELGYNAGEFINDKWSGQELLRYIQGETRILYEKNPTMKMKLTNMEDAQPDPTNGLISRPVYPLGQLENYGSRIDWDRQKAELEYMDFINKKLGKNGVQVQKTVQGILNADKARDGNDQEQKYDSDDEMPDVDKNGDSTQNNWGVQSQKFDHNVKPEEIASSYNPKNFSFAFANDLKPAKVGDKFETSLLQFEQPKVVPELSGASSRSNMFTQTPKQPDQQTAETQTSSEPMQLEQKPEMSDKQMQATLFDETKMLQEAQARVEELSELHKALQEVQGHYLQQEIALREKQLELCHANQQLEKVNQEFESLKLEYSGQFHLLQQQIEAERSEKDQYNDHFLSIINQKDAELEQLGLQAKEQGSALIFGEKELQYALTLEERDKELNRLNNYVQELEQMVQRSELGKQELMYHGQNLQMQYENLNNQFNQFLPLARQVEEENKQFKELVLPVAQQLELERNQLLEEKNNQVLSNEQPLALLGDQMSNDEQPLLLGDQMSNDDVDESALDMILGPRGQGKVKRPRKSGKGLTVSNEYQPLGSHFVHVPSLKQGQLKITDQSGNCQQGLSMNISKKLGNAILAASKGKSSSANSLGKRDKSLFQMIIHSVRGGNVVPAETDESRKKQREDLLKSMKSEGNDSIGVKHELKTL